MTKLGPSAINGTADARAWAARAPIVKQQGHTDVLQAAHPNAVRVYRWPFRDQDLTAPAERVRDAILNGLAGYRHPNLYVEVYVGVPGSMWRAHLAFLQRVVPLLHAAGLKVIGPSWYTGDYEAEAWQGFRAAGWAGLDLIGVQAYWSTAGFTIHNALRWRRFWRPIDPSVVVVECFRDQVRDGPNGTLLPRDGAGRYGFQRQGVGDEQAIAELVAYDTEIEKGGECVGALPFVCGPTDDWRDSGFDLDPIAGRLAALSTPRVIEPKEQPVVATNMVDISNTNGGGVDLDGLKAAGVVLVGMKASQGRSFADLTFPAYWEGCAEWGLARLAYFFWNPDDPELGSTGNEDETSALFARQIESVGGLRDGDLIAGDFEAGNGNQLDRVARVLELVEDRCGVRPGKYSARWWTRAHGVESSDLAKYWTWWANYEATIGGIPTGWENPLIWQTGVGTVPGVVGDLDLDTLLVPLPDLLARGYRGGNDVIQLNDADKAAYLALTGQAWSAAEGIAAILAKYGAEGQSAAEWVDQGIKAPVVLSKELTGTNR